MVDPSLIELVKKRQEDAFRVMYEQCIAYVYAIVRRYVPSESHHKDVIQNIFARLFLSIKTFDAEKGAFKPWLRRVAINQCFQHQRERQRRGRLVSLDSIQEVDSGYDPRLSAFSEEEFNIYLRGMPEGYKRVFMLVAIDEYSHEEVADLLDISAGTSRSQFLRAKKWLERRINSLNPKITAGNGK